MNVSSRIWASAFLAASLSVASLGLALPVVAEEADGTEPTVVEQVAEDVQPTTMEDSEENDLTDVLDVFGDGGLFDDAVPLSDNAADDDGVPLSEDDVLDAEGSVTAEAIPTYTLTEGVATGHNDGQLVRYNITLNRTDTYLFMLKMIRSNKYWSRYGGVITLYKRGAGSDSKVFQGVITTNLDNYKYFRRQLTAGSYYLDVYWNSGGYESTFTAYYILTFQGNNYGKSEVTHSTTTSKGTTMIRMYNPYTGEHFYTSNNSEIDNLYSLGWSCEGVAWTAPKSSKTPVYRLYNKYTGDHHYTTSKDEYESCAAAGWNKEDIAWYSDDSKGTPLYRQYNPYATTGAHNYTTSKVERDNLINNGWRKEGIGWYGVK